MSIRDKCVDYIKIHMNKGLGNGTYGYVFEVDGKEIGISNKLALKIYQQNPELDNDSIKNEIKISKIMGDNNIGPKIYDTWTCNDINDSKMFIRDNKSDDKYENYSNHIFPDQRYYFMLMEKIDGITLGKYSDDNKKIIPQNLSLKILDTVSKMHKLNILHNDLHVNNILITNKEDIKIIDFGLATIDSNITNKEKKRELVHIYELSQFDLFLYKEKYDTKDQKCLDELKESISKYKRLLVELKHTTTVQAGETKLWAVALGGFVVNIDNIKEPKVTLLLFTSKIHALKIDNKKYELNKDIKFSNMCDLVSFITTKFWPILYESIKNYKY